MSHIPPNVVSFIETTIDSLWQLELLLFLKNSPAPLTSEELGNALYVHGDSIQDALVDFEKLGLVKKTGADRYSYSPCKSELHRDVQDTAKAYRDRRFGIVSLIFSNRTERSRTYED